MVKVSPTEYKRLHDDNVKPAIRLEYAGCKQHRRIPTKPIAAFTGISIFKMETPDIIKNIIFFILIWPLRQLALLIINCVRGGPNVPLPPIGEDILRISATELASKIRRKQITAVEAVEACIRRIKEINDISNCVVTDRFDDALKEAIAVDILIADGSKSEEELEREKPFLGVPFTVKNGIALKGHPQTAGVIWRKDVIAEEDAETVTLLKTSGAIAIATTNVPELMFWWESNNKLYGRTRNPYHSEYTTAGSSGGEAALIAAAGSFMGLGSDLGGSIRLPSFMCGIFGHVPTRKMVSLEGIFPIHTTEQARMSTIGPMSRSAKDLKPMLKVLTKNSKVDLKLNEPVDLKKLRYYYIDDFGGNPFVNGADRVDPQVKKTIHSVIDYIDNTYGVTVVKVDIPEMKDAFDLWWARIKGADKLSLSEVINDCKSKTNIPWETVKSLFGQSDHVPEILLIAAMDANAAPYGSPKHTANYERAEKLERTLKELLRDDGVLICPTQPKPPLKHQETMLRPWNLIYTAVFNCTILPVTQCPISQTKCGLPLGVQIAAAPYQDRLSIAVAEELEKAFGGWKPPPSK